MKKYFLTIALILSSLYLAGQEPGRILIFSATKGFRHSSIEIGRNAISRLCIENHIQCDSTENPADFNDQFLGKYDVIIFLNTTGDLFNETQQKALQKYIHNGGGWVGIHAATDAEYEWVWYGKLAGAYFKSHPEQQEAIVRVTARDHIATRMLPAEWRRYDEWYNYKGVNKDLEVLAYLDESSYKGGEMDNQHPIVWYHEFEGGKAFYTGFGHTDATFQDPLFMEHLLGGIKLASRSRK